MNYKKEFEQYKQHVNTFHGIKERKVIKMENKTYCELVSELSKRYHEWEESSQNSIAEEADALYEIEVVEKMLRKQLEEMEEN